jgi:hypothetical protein
MHLLRCQQHVLVQGSKISAWTDFAKRTRTCLFSSCGYDLAQAGPSGAMTHINSHFVTPRRVSSVCRWNHCGSKTLTKTKLLDHLTSRHGIPLRHDSMKQAGFCHECSEFFIHEDVWEEHCASHLSDPDLFCGQIVCRGIIIVARKCVFCLSDANLTAAERYHGFTHAPSFFRHLQTHLQSIFEWPTRCPHPKCSAAIASEVAFWAHLRAVHGIAKYKPESHHHADVAAVTVPGRDCVSEAEMTDTDTSSVDVTDADNDDGDDEGTNDAGIAETHETLQSFQDESVAQHYLVDLSMPSVRTSSLADTTQNWASLHRSSGNGARSSGHAGVDRKTDQEGASTRLKQLFSTNRPDFDIEHQEGEGTDTRDRHPEITTCMQAFPDLPQYNVLGAQKLQGEQVYSRYFGEDARSRSMSSEGVLRSPENGFTVAVSVAKPLDPDLAMSRTMVSSDEPDGKPVTSTVGSEHSRIPDTSSTSGTVVPQVPNEICAIAPRTACGVEQHPYLRPIPSQAGSACDALGCTEVFRFARDLNYHLMKVHKRSQHTCHMGGCGKMFRDPTRLRDHVRTHSDKKALVCSFEQCGRTFARPDTLLRHRQNVHEKEKPYTCDLMKDSRRCNSAFDASWKLKRHKEGSH